MSVEMKYIVLHDEKYEPYWTFHETELEAQIEAERTDSTYENSIYKIKEVQKTGKGKNRLNFELEKFKAFI